MTTYIDIYQLSGDSKILIAQRDLYQKFFVIGRSPKDCDLPLRSRRVSRMQCTFIRQDAGSEIGKHYILIDGILRGELSKNGLFLNNRSRIYYRALKHLDRINFDQFEIVYHEEDKVNEDVWWKRTQ